MGEVGRSQGFILDGGEWEGIYVRCGALVEAIKKPYGHTIALANVFYDWNVGGMDSE